MRKIKNHKTEDLTELVYKIIVCMTKYSSIFCKLSYTKYSIIYYQFDKQEFSNSDWKTGYFDYIKKMILELC